MSLRAAIRAHVRAAASNTAAQRDARAQMAHDAVAYFDLALKYHTPVAPSLIAVGGLSGSGKSRLARELAPHIGSSPGAYIARSDAIRKRITGVSINDRLPSMAYRPDMSQQTYDQLYIEAREALSAGYAVVADAVFARPTERQAIRQVADQLGVPFQGIWLEAAPDEMAHRISTRQRNISDATPDVLRQQLGYDLGPMEWQRIDSSGKRKVTLATALKFLTDRLATAGAPIAA
jgi:predicted kinase